ncbi:MAG: glycosyltransferase family 2 protein [Opitutaceae bacterium]|nr:glycosyltransferase family 2 protein [Verrucomicrobiales bacterium]
MLLTLIYCFVAIVFVAMTVSSLFHLRWVRRLPQLSSQSDAKTSPDAGMVRCSIVLAARNEEGRIEDTVRRLLNQRGVEVEVIVVDDRSTDGTGEILSRLAAEDGRVRYRRIDSLPEGWLGKCHACHVGAGLATGRWILFTDADCWLKSDVLARALQEANREDAQHITLTPGVVPETLGAQAWHLVIHLSLAKLISGANRDRPGGYLGVGAFNLVQSGAYRECGGYEALRLTVVDDIKLGLLLRRAGKKTRAFIGGDDAECHWGSTVRAAITIMEKNYFAAIDYRTGLVLGMVAASALLWGTALAGLVSGSPAGLVAGLAPLLSIYPGSLVAKRLGWSMRGALLTPFIYPVVIYAVVNSAVVTLWQGGVRWRDTFYSLDGLRAGNIRR